ncbi:2OG-Fe(II) oxygenase [Pseudoalteromonas aurantia]|uniref:Proline hydroxylase n=1 Tax=Pseudoalteromonas aurantia TaxID=43654 RepID=A0A5S3V769_9GAMM|nr:2OG-Fe(II) oxygenase [Pseudoalteromonas aurantia]TMO62281.1 proline hydroxylase [Pseudoalteromonas aurantia]TMO67574.1 proline hydroxylase [Pseudoalteromonas aurantia]TMO73347.1 proline hydroxylase [Pseudoalteromonas aurantia]
MQSTDELFDRIAHDLRVSGLSIQAIDKNAPALQALTQRLALFSDGDFATAGIGRQTEHTQNSEIRRDKIHWLDSSDPLEETFLSYMDGLKNHLNSQLFMGLFSYECHFAHYEPGAFYKKHVDAFKGNTNRVLSTVLYLNQDWQSEYGGELALYDTHDHELLTQKVTPHFGTLVTFLSDEFPHEVLPATQPRYSIAGWFRVNSSVNGQVDPPR